jgi:ATP-dependent helicase HrpB
MLLAARMVGGRGVMISQHSSVEKAELFLAIDSMEPPPGAGGLAGGVGGRRDVQISIASRVERDWVKKLFPESVSRNSQLIFDSENGIVQKALAESFHDLALEEPHLSRPSADEAFPVLLAACEERWETHFLQQNEGLKRALSRFNFLASQFGDEVDEASLIISDTRLRMLEEACFGETRLSEVLAKPLGEVFIRHLPPKISALLQDAAPDTIQVPSGSRIPVQYPEERAPYLEVRIQEIFGLKESPRVARGKVPIVFHLLKKLRSGYWGPSVRAAPCDHKNIPSYAPPPLYQYSARTDSGR